MRTLDAEKLRDLIAFCQNNDILIELDENGITEGVWFLYVTAKLRIPKEKEPKESEVTMTHLQIHTEKAEP